MSFGFPPSSKTFAALLATLVGLGVEQAHASPGGGYVDSALCAACHPKVAASYARTGMARSFGQVSPESKFAGLENATLRHPASREFFTVSRRDAAPFLRRYQIGFEGQAANILEKKIDYWFGSGDHARSYLSREPSGALIELPVTWYAENGGSWAMSPGFDSAQHPGFSRKIADRCMFCHTAIQRTASATPQGIDCQRCHGPGSDHLDAVRQQRGSAAIRKAIVNPARLTPDRRIEVCLQCHLETTTLNLPGSLVRYDRDVFSYQPGEPLGSYAFYFDHAPGAGREDKFEFVSSAYRLFKSACYRESRQALTCTTCHDPHGSQTEEAAASRYARICRNCHAGKIDQLAAESRHSASTDCVSCHMPKRRPSDAPHITIADHYIQRAPKHDQALPHVEGADAPPYRGKVALYYPSVAAGEAELYLAVAQVKAQANLQDGIAGLEQAIRRFQPANPQFYLDLADAYRHAGDMAAAAAKYREASLRDPKRWAVFHGLGLALAGGGDLPGSLAALQKAQSLAPFQAVVVESLANVLVRLQRVPDAVAVLRRGIAADPNSADLHNHLGTALLRAGDRTGAEAELREAVRLRPELAAMRLNLAGVLSRGAGFTEAKYEFAQAIQIDPASAEAHSAYGTALAAHSDWREAKVQFLKALSLNPRLANSHNNLGTAYRQMGEPENAIREYRKAIEIQPGFATAHYNLAVALAAKGEKNEAERQLEEAIHFAPDYSEAHLALGRMLVERGRPDLAAVHLRH